MEHYLTLKQNLCSARIFLNTFGLSLETLDVINEFSKLKIFNKNKEVGLLYFENGCIKIKSINYLLSSPNDIEEFPGGHGLSIKHNIFRVPYSLYLLSKYQRKTLNIEETKDFSRILK